MFPSLMTNQLYLTKIVTHHSFHFIATLTWALSSECKTGQAHLLILQIGCPSYNLISLRKSGLIQNSSSQIPSAFNKHRIAKTFRKIWRKMKTTTTKKNQESTVPSAILIKFTTKLHLHSYLVFTSITGCW